MKDGIFLTVRLNEEQLNHLIWTRGKMREYPQTADATLADALRACVDGDRVVFGVGSPACYECRPSRAVVEGSK